MKLTFHGGAKLVTGANYLLESDSGQKILIDCGLRQGSRYCERSNFEPFPYDPSEIHALVVTHAHIDHIGRVPKLFKDGFNGKVYSTPPTKDFAEHLLEDSMNILSKDAKEGGQEPIYTEADIKKALANWETYEYHEPIEVGEFGVEFYDAGHVLGSSIVKISAHGKTIVFSGDLGNSPAPLIRVREEVESADYVLMESTYGARVHEDVSKRKSILEDVIEETVQAGGTLMIPAFALERTQQLLFELNELVENGRIPEVPVFIDSPLAIRLTEVYRKYSKNPKYFNDEAIELEKSGDAIFDFPGLKFTKSTDESKAIAGVAPPKVIIAGAGMSQGGRIIHHEKMYLSDPKNTLLFIGYQANGSMGRRILDGAKEVKILGEKVPVRAKQRAIGGYSAHADQPALLTWLAPMRPSLKKVFLIQGEEDQMGPLAQKIRDEMTLDVSIPSPGDVVELL